MNAPVPVSRSAPVAATARHDRPASPDAPTLLRILLIEDNPADVRLAQERLRDSGISCDVAAALTEVTAARLAAVHCAVIDLGLPDATGLQALDRVRALAPNVPTVVLTGLNDDLTGLTALRAGAEDYLIKQHTDGYDIARAVRFAVARKHLQLAVESRVQREFASAEVAASLAQQAVERDRDEILGAITAHHSDQIAELADLETLDRDHLYAAILGEPIEILAAGIMQLDLLSSRLDPGHRFQLDQIATHLGQATTWLRDVVGAALIPPDLSDGLVPALTSLASTMFDGAHVVCRVTGSTRDQLPPDTTDAAYRIMREALLNARRHAHPNTITLTLDDHDDGTVVLTLNDDGVGSDQLGDGSGHLGVAAMRARAAAAGGHLHIDSAPGHGTLLTLTLPSSST